MPANGSLRTNQWAGWVPCAPDWSFSGAWAKTIVACPSVPSCSPETASQGLGAHQLGPSPSGPMIRPSRKARGPRQKRPV